MPRLNAHARGFFKDNCEKNNDITLSLLEEEKVLKTIFDSKISVGPDSIAAQVGSDVGQTGDQILLYGEHGPTWVQYVIAPGGAIPDRYLLFTGDGRQITNAQTIDYIQEVYPELKGFRVIAPVTSLQSPSKDIAPGSAHEEQIVEVHGSSAWFEYQFPASPEFFVGRADALAEVERYADEVLRGTTSARGLLFTANSGWGKSSIVLASADLLRRRGHFTVVIDCRSISSPQSILRIVDFALRRIAAEKGELFLGASAPISGFEGAVHAILQASKQLQAEKRLVFVFLDQFENVFFLPDTLKRIRDLLLRICDVEVNLILGFAWKTDLIGATNEFPYQERDAIASASKRIPLEPFSEVETTALLDKLRSELRREKEISDPDDVFFAARDRKQEIKEQIRDLQAGLARQQPKRPSAKRKKRS